MPEVKIITKNWGLIDPMSIDSYIKKGGYKTLHLVLRNKQPRYVVEEIKMSGLRGRGGAGFYTGLKWEMAVKAKGRKKYFICNLDESEPGTYKDRLIAENNPHLLLEGILIGAYAIGAREGFIYLNGSFHLAKRLLENALKQCYEKKILGKSIMGTTFDFDLKIFVGAGAYVCGEETALLNSLEGYRGEPRFKDVYPCEKGLFRQPTIVNNAETIANIPWIIKNGAEKFSKIGIKNSPGTKLYCLNGMLVKPGLFEAPLGISIRELIFDYAGGMQPGFDLWFTQIGGSSGKLVLLPLLDRLVGYGDEKEISIGQGSILVVHRGCDVKKLILSWINFFQRESCGKCVPCREGTLRLKLMVERLVNGEFDKNDAEDMRKIIWILENTTFCPLGKFAVMGLKDVIKYRLVEELNG